MLKRIVITPDKAQALNKPNQSTSVIPKVFVPITAKAVSDIVLATLIDTDFSHCKKFFSIKQWCKPNKTKYSC